MKKKHPKRAEQILVFDNKTLVAGRCNRSGRMRHFDRHYKIVSDRSKGKKRTLVLELQDRKEMERKKREIIETIAKATKDNSETFKALLNDALSDYIDSAISEMHARVVEKKQPVKVQEGCFKIVVGDGRKKNHGEIMLRE